MRKKLFIRAASFVALLMFVFASCNNSDTTKTQSANPESAGSNNTDTVPHIDTVFAGKLDTLWMDAATFVNLGQSTMITFRFYIDTPNNISLRGWTGNSNNWDKAPDVFLKKGRQSTIKFGTGSYFGNLQISNKQYIAVKKALDDSKSKYVVFGPVNPTTGIEIGQIVYKIYVTSDDPGPTNATVVYKFVLEDTKIETNPSPPKSSN